MEIDVVEAHEKNFGDRRRGLRPEWIVVHYTGTGAGARSVARFFSRPHRRPRSTHFLIDGKSIIQCVPVDKSAWHVGGPSASKKIPVENSNSLGVDLCEKKANKKNISIRDRDWYFEDETLFTAAEFIAKLCADFDIPISRVVRHFDVTGKECPLPFQGLGIYPQMPGAFAWFTGDESWKLFKKMIVDFMR